MNTNNTTTERESNMVAELKANVTAMFVVGRIKTMSALLRVCRYDDNGKSKASRKSSSENPRDPLSTLSLPLKS